MGLMICKTNTATDTSHADLRSVQVVPHRGVIGEDVTELPGHGATKEQVAMLHTRYDLAARLSTGKDVLEVACGPGVGLGWIARSAERVVGGDLNPENVRSAASHYASRLEVLEVDAQDLPFPDESFDVIVFLDSIYWLPDATRFIAEARRVLRPEGTLFISTSNPERKDFNACPYATRYYAAAELNELLVNDGFSVDLAVGFPVQEGDAGSRFVSLLQTVAAKLRLIPKSMAWKIWLKQLVFGKLDSIPTELVVDRQLCRPLSPIDSVQSLRDYKIIYAVGRRAA